MHGVTVIRLVVSTLLSHLNQFQRVCPQNQKKKTICQWILKVDLGLGKTGVTSTLYLLICAKSMVKAWYLPFHHL